MAYKVGDLVHWVLGSTAGEGLFIGQLKRNPNVLVVAIGLSVVEIDAAGCSPAGGGQPPLGASYRREYLKQHPGALEIGSGSAGFDLAA